MFPGGCRGAESPINPPPGHWPKGMPSHDNSAPLPDCHGHSLYLPVVGICFLNSLPVHTSVSAVGSFVCFRNSPNLSINIPCFDYSH